MPVLPGRFFLLSHDPATEYFTLVVDDGNRSSYNLGDDIQRIMRYFRMVGHKELGYRDIDAAKDFGAAKAVFSRNHVEHIRARPCEREKRDPFTMIGKGIPAFI